MIHKVRNGQTIQGAVEDIITRAVGELRKGAFGDDTDDTKGRSWTREQAWKVVKALSSKPEVRDFTQRLLLRSVSYFDAGPVLRHAH